MKPKGPDKINRYSDLIRVRGQLDSLMDNDYEIEGVLKVYPSKEYEFNSKEDLDSIISNINVFSSPYASMDGNFTVRPKKDH